MKLIVGLGNPGGQYVDTRHNIGFMIVEHLSHELGSSTVNWKNDDKHKAMIAKTGDVILVKPLTFMNESGIAVKALMDFYKVTPADIWVIHDDIDLPLGKIRIRQKGGTAGHNGVTSILDHLKSDTFVRFRMGIGRGKESTGPNENKNLSHRSVIAFVLSRFKQSEAGSLKHLVKHGSEAVRIALTEGMDKAMNRFNQLSMQKIGDILLTFNPVEDKYISREFQSYGIYLAEQLGDYTHKALYIRLAKTVPRAILEKALSFTKDANANSKGRLFMWKMKKLKNGEEQAILALTHTEISIIVQPKLPSGSFFIVMTLELELRQQSVFFVEDPPINMVAMNYEAILDQENSPGARARKLWGQKFCEVEPYARDYIFIPTGIGGAPGSNRDIEVAQFGDGSIVAPFIDLEETFGRVPKILYLLASPYTADGVLNLAGLADIYKSQGVESIIAMLTSLGQERQDGYFKGKNGKLRKQVPTLRYVIENLARHVDGAFLNQPHSLVSTEIGLQYGFPIIPIDPLKRMMRQFRQRIYRNGIVLGPDFGRKDDGRMAAASLQWPMASGLKIRDREHKGVPSFYLDQRALHYIREHQCTVFIYDDEIRQGGTLSAILGRLAGYAKEVVYCAVKAFCADDEDGKTAIDYLEDPLLTRIIFTDAVGPLNTFSETVLKKLEIVQLEPELQQLARYVSRHMAEPNNLNWLRKSSETGTDLRLDLSVEDAHKS